MVGVYSRDQTQKRVREIVLVGVSVTTVEEPLLNDV